MKTIKWLLNLENIKFLLRRISLRFIISTTPHLDSEESKAWFIQKIKDSKYYLEYGSGGSTYIAAQHKVNFISIESDWFFLKALIRKIKKDHLYNQNIQIYYHRSIGLTKKWSYPIDSTNISEKKSRLYRDYSNPPVECILNDFIPDFIFIDGRFRVACALKIIKLLNNKSSRWTIAIDDYFNRPHYHVVEKYAELNFCIGLMGVFTKGLALPNDIDRDISYYEFIAD